jgi:ABC-type nickel/cobalt efflux system permease component RcnA
VYNEKNFKTAHPLTFGLSLVAGMGVTVIMLALGIGVVQADANPSVIGAAIWAGVALMAIGIGGWIAVTRPFAHFDDINQPLEADHGHGHAHVTDQPHIVITSEATHDEHGHPIVIREDHPVQLTSGGSTH